MRDLGAQMILDAIADLIVKLGEWRDEIRVDAANHARAITELRADVMGKLEDVEQREGEWRAFREHVEAWEAEINAWRAEHG